MRPIIIGIGGGHSGAGKTGIACEILRKHPGWGAIKYTKTSLYGSITDDINVLSEKGKDTRRFLDSGAGKVVWVQSPYQDLLEISPLALEMLSHLEGIVVEGNSAVEYLRPEIVIFVSGSGEKIKDGAEKILQIADVVIYDREPPVEMPQGVKKFQRDEVENILDFISQTINNLRHK
jgi:molybdopterin-guanine dinucleotide biosynthesis protein